MIGYEAVFFIYFFYWLKLFYHAQLRSFYAYFHEENLSFLEHLKTSPHVMCIPKVKWKKFSVYIGATKSYRHMRSRNKSNSKYVVIILLPGLCSVLTVSGECGRLSFLWVILLRSLNYKMYYFEKSLIEYLFALTSFSTIIYAYIYFIHWSRFKPRNVW